MTSPKKSFNSGMFKRINFSSGNFRGGFIGNPLKNQVFSRNFDIFGEKIKNP